MNVRDGILFAMEFILTCFLIGGILGVILCMVDNHSHSHSDNQEDFKPEASSKLWVIPPSPHQSVSDQATICHDCHVIEKKQDSDSKLTGK